ncbi:reverse transcriptase domain-containing protein [Tanacetum coccineum]
MECEPLIFLNFFVAVDELWPRVRANEMLPGVSNDVNNLLSELKIGMHELGKEISDILVSRNEVKGITKRGGKITEVNHNKEINESNLKRNEPLKFQPNEQEEPEEAVVNKEPKIILERNTKPPINPQQPSVPFSSRLRTKKKEAQQRKVGDDEVIFDMDQSMKNPSSEDDECYGIDNLDDTISNKTQELLEGDHIDSFLVKGLEKEINQRDLEKCNSVGGKLVKDSDVESVIQRIDSPNMAYRVEQKAEQTCKIKNKHLYSASANEIDEKKPELKILPSHLEYAYLHGDESFPIIISSKLFVKEKKSLLQVLEKHKGEIAWKMSDIKGIRFFQIPIAPEDQNKTTFNYPYGTFAYRRMPFGLYNAPATFQRYMTAIFHDIVEDFMEVFMDEFFVFGNSFDWCLANLDKMLARYYVNYLVGKVIPSKWTFKKRKRFYSQVKKYFWDEPYAFKLCPDNIMRRCVAGNEISKFFTHCHSRPTRGHYSASVTGRKVYESRFGVPKALISDRGTEFCNYQLEKALQKYGVTHKLSTVYHPQSNGQTEFTNRAIKHILERSVGYNPKDWSEKLNDALWAFGTAYKTPTGCTPFRLVYGNACHLPVEIQHKAYWALNQCNADLEAAGKNRFMQLNELAELRDRVYENTRIYKERTNKWHDSRLCGDQDFKVSIQRILVLGYDVWTSYLVDEKINVETSYAVFTDKLKEYSGRYQTWSPLQETPIRRIMEIEPDIENMTLNEYLEYEAKMERRIRKSARSKRNPTIYEE